MKYIDLFCGIGSFHYSFKKFGWECVMACDLEESARNTYKKNYNMQPLSDICDIDPTTVKPYDILCAGFPCQPFSQAGFRKGFKDKRGPLFWQIMKFVHKNNPKIIILENVQGLKNHDNGNTFLIITEELKSAGYNFVYKILKCSDYGIPQMRKRIFIVAFRQDMNIDLTKLFELDKYKKSITLSDFFGKKFKKDTAYTIRCGGRHSAIDNRHNWDGYWVDNKEYRLTIDDALLLQGFENFQLMGSKTKQWKLLGNTIPTIFTEILGKQIQMVLKNHIISSCPPAVRIDYKRNKEEIGNT